MNTKFVGQVLLIVMITALLVMILTVYYNDYWNLNPVIYKTESVRSNDFMSDINKVMTSQGIQCEEMSYAEQDEMQLKMYWELLNNYRQFHMDGVRKINSGKSSHVRTLTWHCSDAYPCGGLGYRFLGIATNLLFAIFTNRVLLLKWDRASAENAYLVPNMIDWRYPSHSLKGSSNNLGSFHAGTMKSFEKKMVESLTGNTMHVQMLYNRAHATDEIIPKLNMTHTKHLANLQLFYTLSFMYLFKVSKELKLFAGEVHNMLGLHGQRYVALHIRTGQFNEHSRYRFINSSKQIMEAAQCAIKQADEHIGPDSVVVVVSDSASVKQRLAEKYSRVKILDNSIVHVDKAEELDSDAMLGTWQDIIIMAEAHILIYHGSAFPQVSVALCGLPKERFVKRINNKCFV